MISRSAAISYGYKGIQCLLRNINHRQYGERALPFEQFIRGLHVASLQWRPVTRLRDGSLEEFREDAFSAQKPALLYRGPMTKLPAIERWFRRTKKQGSFELDQAYLKPFGNAMVPLELSSILERADQENGVTFHRSEAPLSVFLQWADSASFDTRQRLYLAQASISELPEQMRVDLPTPELVLEAGKGDVYDTNLWLGVAPTYTPLHRDPNPNLFVQLVGRKIVRLLPPEAGQEVFSAIQIALGRDASSSFRGDEMMQGEEKRLLEDQIWGDYHAHDGSSYYGHEATLMSGDGLFIPKGWWHSIKGVGTGITGSVNWWFR